MGIGTWGFFRYSGLRIEYYFPFMKRRRLDEILIESGCVKDRKEAFVIVTEGRVRIDGQKAVTPAQWVSGGARVEMREAAPYVGRGALKLVAALDAFPIVVAGKICADIGAATGGFTEVLLERGATKVYAIDTARGKLALKIRRDPRVVVMERTDARDVQKLPEQAEVVAVDVSLISLRDILPSARRLLAPRGAVIALFKPQYETRDPRILHHGVIRNPVEREKLVADFTIWLTGQEWSIIDRMESPITGSKGNVEYLLHLKQR